MGISNGLKKLVSISFFIFLAVVAAVLVSGLVFYQNDKPNLPVKISGLPVSGGSSGGEQTLGLEEISKHNSIKDCWMIIGGKVYDFTSYLGAHPGGAAPMLPYCGKDGSEAFATKDQRNARPHSEYANSLLSNYYLGDLNQTVGAAQIRQNTHNSNQVTPPPKGREEYDD